jgi:hypothetical protein
MGPFLIYYMLKFFFSLLILRLEVFVFLESDYVLLSSASI